LDKGVFRLPETESVDVTSIEIDERALDDLLDGIDLQTSAAKSRAPATH
jgi:hypothetical protein